MTPEECKKAQRLILNVIGSNLEQIAVYEFMLREKHSIWLARRMIDYYTEWNNDLENQYKTNVLLIREGFYGLVESLSRHEPPEFYEGL